MTCPTYFGPATGPLYGVHQAPTGPEARATGVLLCYPVFREYQQAHRSFRELSSRLSRAGFHVLRFDYTGYGDSSGDGESWCAERAVEDIGEGAAELRRRSGCHRVAMIGLRLGATLAALAARQERSVTGLVLWEPVVAGRSYLRELEAMEREWWRMGYDVPRRGSGPVRELMGCPLPPAARASIEAIDLLALERAPAWPAPRVLLAMGSSRRAVAVDLERHLTRLGCAVTRQGYSGPPVWSEERILVPSDELGSMVTWCAGLDGPDGPERLDDGERGQDVGA